MMHTSVDNRADLECIHPLHWQDNDIFCLFGELGSDKSIGECQV